MKKGGRCIADGHYSPRQMRPPQFQRGSRACIAHLGRQRWHRRIAQRADHLIGGGQPRACDPFADHMRVAQDWRACLKRCARDNRHARGEADMRLQPDHTCGMDHSNDNDLFLGCESRQIGLGAYRGKGLQIDCGPVGFIGMRHQNEPFAITWAVVRPLISAASCAQPPWIRSKPCGDATKVTSARVG